MFVRQTGFMRTEEFWDFCYVHSVTSCAGSGGEGNALLQSGK